MRFALPPEVFADDAAGLDALDRLLDRVSDEVHHLIVLDPDHLEQTAWFHGLRPHRKELVRSVVRAVAFMTPGRRLVVGQNLPLPAAARLAYKALLVLVEGEESDGLLVEVAIDTYGHAQTKRLWKHRPATGAAVTVLHGGGTGSLQTKLERIVREAEAEALPARLIVMTDSDARWPGEISTKASSIEQLCTSHAVPFVVLSCRNAESYIPDAVLLRWSKDPGRVAAQNHVDALTKLTVEQRDHYRMKGGSTKPGQERHGLREVDRPDAPEEQRALYASLSAADRAVLTGFHDKIISVLKDPQLTASELDARDSRGDLRTLVSIIEEAL
jgi:hypothetical protein